jgi:hypothetical protein
MKIKHISSISVFGFLVQSFLLALQVWMWVVLPPSKEVLPIRIIALVIIFCLWVFSIQQIFHWAKRRADTEAYFEEMDKRFSEENATSN